MQKRPAEGGKPLPPCAGWKGYFSRHARPALSGGSPPFAPLAVLLRQNRRAAPLLGKASDAGAPGRGEQFPSPLRRLEGMLSPARWACTVWRLSSVRSARGFSQVKSESSPAAGWGVGCRSARPRGASRFPPAPAERDAFPGTSSTVPNRPAASASVWVRQDEVFVLPHPVKKKGGREPLRQAQTAGPPARKGASRRKRARSLHPVKGAFRQIFARSTRARRRQAVWPLSLPHRRAYNREKRCALAQYPGATRTNPTRRRLPL